MKRLVILLLFLGAINAVCLADVRPLRIAVSIAPQVESVRAVAGEDAEIVLLVPPGSSPETFSVSPRNTAAVGTADLYVKIGAPCEKALLRNLEHAFPKLPVLDARQGMTLRKMAAGEEHHHDGEKKDHAEEKDHVEKHEHGVNDPHVWLDPRNMKIHTLNVAEALAKMQPEHAEVYRANAKKYCERLDALDKEFEALFGVYNGRTILVFHPAFGYFLDRYHLKQLPVEKDGKEPTGRHLVELMKQVRTLNIGTLFVQPQFKSETVRTLANEIKCRIAVLDPLPLNYWEGLRKLGYTIRQGIPPTPMAQLAK